MTENSLADLISKYNSISLYIVNSFSLSDRSKEDGLFSFQKQFDLTKFIDEPSFSIDFKRSCFKVGFNSKILCFLYKLVSKYSFPSLFSRFVLENKMQN